MEVSKQGFNISPTSRTVNMHHFAPSTAGITLSVEQIIDMVPIFSNITLSRSNNGFPQRYTIRVNESDFDPNGIKWEISGAGIHSGQTIPPVYGPEFELDARDIRYNSLGGHALILTVSKNGLEYRRAIPFTIVR